MKTYWIGRSPDCHIQISDDSVSRLHAELVIAHDGRYFLTDCASSHGTFIQKNQRWVALGQGYVEAQQALRLGHQQTTIAKLLQAVTSASGQLERNPETGEILL